MSFPGTRCF